LTFQTSYEQTSSPAKPCRTYYISKVEPQISNKAEFLIGKGHQSRSLWHP